MKTKQSEQNNLVEGGRENWEGTDEFQRKVEEIVKELTAKYSPALSNERNWAKRLLIKVRLKIEIRKKIAELSSLRNLFVIYHRYG